MPEWNLSMFTDNELLMSLDEYREERAQEEDAAGNARHLLNHRMRRVEALDHLIACLMEEIEERKENGTWW